MSGSCRRCWTGGNADGILLELRAYGVGPGRPEDAIGIRIHRALDDDLRVGPDRFDDRAEAAARGLRKLRRHRYVRAAARRKRDDLLVGGAVLVEQGDAGEIGGTLIG